MYTYRGYEVLDAVPDSTSDDTMTLRAKVSSLASVSGVTTRYDLSGIPAAGRTVTLLATSREEIAELRAFFARRQGRAVAFWLPSFTISYEVARASEPLSSEIVVNGTNFSDYGLASRRELFYRDAITSEFRHLTVLDAAPNGDGTETLVLESYGVGVPVGALLNTLNFCRLESDANQLVFDTVEVASVTFSTVELPREMPQP